MSRVEVFATGIKAADQEIKMTSELLKINNQEYMAAI